jgi:hypothetical protein
MASFTLDSIREAAEKKYASTEIELPDGDVLVLQNPLRLSKEKRKALTSMQARLDSDEDVEQEDVLADAIRTAALNQDAAEKLLDEVGDDLSILAEIFATYSGETQTGEASASQS